MKSETGYKHGIQTDPKTVQNTIRRNGIYHYQKRIPRDLVEVVAFGYKKNTTTPITYFRYSLHTRDPKEARRLVALENVESELKFERKRKELEESSNEKFIRRINLSDKKKKFSALSAPARRDLIFWYFIDLEKSAERGILNDLDEQDLEELQSELQENHAALAGHPAFQPIDWDATLREFLEKNNIEVDDKTSKPFVEMQRLIQRAHVEESWRSIKESEGLPHQEHDPYFRGLHAYSESPQIKFTNSKTVSELCTSFLQHPEEAGNSYSSCSKYKLNAYILEELLGKNTPIESITVEKAKEVVSFLAKIPQRISASGSSLSLRKASEKEANKPNPRFLAPKTQDDKFTGIKAIFKLRT